VADKTTVRWESEMSFDVELHGHHFSVDADEEFGGRDRGPKPKGLVLSALAGCTGMDVVSILGKMRMPFDGFRVEVEGEIADEHPRVFTKIHIRYILTGDQLDEAKVERAVSLSCEKYCAVHAMLSKSSEVTHEILLNP